MDIKIRGVSDPAISKIDVLAKKEGLSRNEFLKYQIEYMSIINELKSEREKFESALREIRMSLEKSYDRLDKMEHGYEKMFLMLSIATGINLKEVDNFLQGGTSQN